ncbi:hypothetical protein HMPREF1215_00864 [Coprococcus sp. HPP0074]|jgi:hypothetical protein|nr:hypothetical protein HMPREF1215_00864 [Coprococcus sp. HPP0074]
MEILLILVISAIITYLLFYFTGGAEILLDELVYFLITDIFISLFLIGFYALFIGNWLMKIV